MQFDIITLFPGMFQGPFEESILARARRSGRLAVRIHDLRKWGEGPHRKVDDTPFGGGGGMILKPEPLFAAVEWILETFPAQASQVVLLSPQGEALRHDVARKMAEWQRIVLICGHYEGVDERVREHLVDSELSVGDFVLTGGELPAMMAVDAISRFVPGVLGRDGAAEKDSFADGHLEYPYYTRPARFRDLTVPEVLLSGDHQAIASWRQKQAREVTRIRRPDLLGKENREPDRNRGK